MPRGRAAQKRRSPLPGGTGQPESTFKRRTLSATVSPWARSLRAPLLGLRALSQSTHSLGADGPCSVGLWITSHTIADRRHPAGDLALFSLRDLSQSKSRPTASEAMPDQ